MGKIVNKPRVQQPYPVQVRPQPELREKLREAADAAGRTLTKEMEFRLAASVRGDQAALDLYSAWPPEDQARFRSLADVVGILCARIALTYGYDGETDTQILGALEPAIVELIRGLSIKRISDDQVGRFMTMLAKQMVNEIRQSANVPNPSGEKAVFAAFAKAWGVNEQTAHGHGAGSAP